MSAEADLDDLLRRAKEAFDALTPEQKVTHRREQKISFAYGNLACSTNHRVPLEVVERAYAKMHPEERCPGSGKHWQCALFVNHPGILHCIVGPYAEVGES